MTTCILLLILSCGSKSAAVLNVASHTAMFADTWSTQRILDRQYYYPGTNLRRLIVHEANPLARSFQEHGKPVAYASTVVAGIGLRAIVGKMRHSANPTVRKLWWLPQVLQIAANIYGVQNNVRLERRIR